MSQMQQPVHGKLVRVPEEWHRKFKVLAARRQTTMARLVGEAMRDYAARAELSGDPVIERAAGAEQAGS